MAGKYAQVFIDGLGVALKCMYTNDDVFMQVASEGWSTTIKIAVALIPLIILLTIMEILKSGAQSVLGTARAREFIVDLLFSIGLAASSYYLMKLIVNISADLGRQMLSLSGMSADNPSMLAKYLINPNILSSGSSGINDTLWIFLVLIRVFMIILMYVSMTFTAISLKATIVLLIIIAPIVFIISSFDLLSWLRQTFLKAFTFMALLPAFDGILLAMIIGINKEYYLTADFFQILMVIMLNIGITFMMVNANSTVIKIMFGQIIDDAKKAIEAAKKIADLALFIAGFVFTGGISSAVQAGAAAAKAGAAGAKAGTAAAKAGSSLGKGFDAFKASMDSSAKAAVASGKTGNASASFADIAHSVLAKVPGTVGEYSRGRVAGNRVIDTAQRAVIDRKYHNAAEETKSQNEKEKKEDVNERSMLDNKSEKNQETEEENPLVNELMNVDDSDSDAKKI